MGFARGIAFWLLAWIASAALWMIHSASAKLPELAAGAGVAALAATATELARRQRVAGIMILPAWLRRAPRLIPSAIRDCAALTRLAFVQLVRGEPVHGRTVAIPFDHGGEEPRDNGRRALAQALGSFAPGTIVLGVDPERNMLIAHQLAASDDPSSLDPLELA